MTRKNLYGKAIAVLVGLSVVVASFGTANAGVSLGATRIVYPSDQKQVTLGVGNNDDKATFLIQSWVESPDGQRNGNFVITPPLFLINGKKENILRIIDATNHRLPKDRESLFWVNVKAIPSLDKSRQDENTLQLAITSRIKLFYRPNGLSIAPDKAPEQLRFKRSGNELTIVNPTPYFITLSELNAGTRQLENTMVSPMGSTNVAFPADAGSTISYRTINDYGAQTQILKSVMQ